MLKLLIDRKFYPLFCVQFLGAFNDNLFKNALVILITFRLSHSAEQTGLLITLAAGLFILPFFLFSALAGQIADRYSKSFLVKKIKLSEVLIMLLGALALQSQNLVLLFTTLFLMGAQSAFFGPIKYALLPEIFQRKALIRANSLFSGSTFIAILLGTIVGGLGILAENGITLVSTLIIATAVVGYLFSLRIHKSKEADSTLNINWNVATSTWVLIKQSQTHSIAWISIICISWFWFIGATLLSQMPNLVKYELQANDEVVVWFLTLFSVGIAFGAVLVSHLMKSRVHLYWHWLFMLGITVSLLLTIWAVSTETGLYQVPRETLMGISELIGFWPKSLGLLFMALLAFLGGVYIVPLYTLLQTYTPFSVRARMVAVNNVFNAFLMVLSALLIMLGFAFSLSLLQMLALLAVANLWVVALLFKTRNLISLPKRNT